MNPNSNYAQRVSIPDDLLAFKDDAREYVEYVIERLKQESAIEIFKEIWRVGGPVVVETHIEEWRDFLEHMTHYQLHYRLTKVQHRNVVVPEFTFVNHSGKMEWKCSSCGTINSIEATYCGERHDHAVGCGHPREKVRQEMSAYA